MDILLTGGSGDLGTALTPKLSRAGHKVSIIDPVIPTFPCDHHFQGSILDVDLLTKACRLKDLVIHIAAWHGFHESAGLKTQTEFNELNVQGTKILCDIWAQGTFHDLIHLSSSSVFKTTGNYGLTKRLAEELLTETTAIYQFRAITLRPRGFIPPWNKKVYGSFLDWARYFWSSGVYIQDVVQAVIHSMGTLPSVETGSNPKFMVDRLPDFSEAELHDWDREGPGSSFQQKFPGCYQLAQQAKLPIHEKPNYFDIGETRNKLGYLPEYSVENMLEELLYQLSPGTLTS